MASGTIMTGITTAINAISSAVSNIGPAIASFCTTVLPKILPALERIGPVITTIANVILPILNVFKPVEDVQNMGDRAIQAAEQGIKPDKFDTFDSYLEEIRNFKLDPEKSSQLDSTAKLAAGLAIGSLGLETKLNVQTGALAPIWILIASNPEYFNPERLKNWLQSGIDMLNVLRYFEGKLGPADAVATRDTLMAHESKLSPDKTDAAIYDELNAARDTAQKTSNPS